MGMYSGKRGGVSMSVYSGRGHEVLMGDRWYECVVVVWMWRSRGQYGHVVAAQMQRSRGQYVPHGLVVWVCGGCTDAEVNSLRVGAVLTS